VRKNTAFGSSDAVISLVFVDNPVTFVEKSSCFFLWKTQFYVDRRPSVPFDRIRDIEQFAWREGAKMRAWQTMKGQLL